MKRRSAWRVGASPRDPGWRLSGGASPIARHEWACFAAQQAAEKAVKALHLHLGQEAWGRVVARLLRELPGSISADLVHRAKVLDNFFVSSR